ncbi:MAG TPA: hypothetical protein VGM68_01655 [Rhizomicrobium sp.]|jgi:hypothetical protein
MQDSVIAVLPLRDYPRSVVAALARACDLLEAGQLADAARWAAVAAGLSEVEAMAQTA